MRAFSGGAAGLPGRRISLSLKVVGVFAVIVGAEGKGLADQGDGNAKGAQGCREIEIVDGLGRVGDGDVIERDQDDRQRKE